MAASAHSSCMWMLLVATCVSLVVGTDCGKDCALCVYRMLGQQSGFSSLTCSIECEGGLDSHKLRVCRDFPLEDNPVSLEADPRQQQEQGAVGAVIAADGDGTSPEHQLTKKYGGFMKRYGGFMSRRSSTPEETLEEPRNREEEENIRLEILKMINTAGEQGGEGDGQRGEAVKRYGGFMRRAEEGSVHSDLLEAVLGRGLKKRYGGFMRRVGRPEWLVDNSKSGGALKRAWENSSELQKRYGGFMD